MPAAIASATAIAAVGLREAAQASASAAIPAAIAQLRIAGGGATEGVRNSKVDARINTESYSLAQGERTAIEIGVPVDDTCRDLA